ncbi:MAG: TraM recognition domain-containing protein [Ornithinimicrobium sp.]
MSRPGRLREPGDQQTLYIALTGLLLAAIAAVAGAWLVARVTNVGPSAASFTSWVAALFSDEPAWNTMSTLVSVVILIVVAALVAVVTVLLRSQSAGRSRVDTSARTMSKPGDMAELEAPHLQREADRLGVAKVCGPGVPLGRAVSTGRPLGTSWEWTQMWIMGTRAGKTTCVCVPQILATGGSALITSNKPDIVTLTRGPRSFVGPVWVHDPQGLAQEPATWYWSPLSYVTTLERADELARLFVAAIRGDLSKLTHWDTEGMELLASLLLAGALGGHTIFDVYDWLLDPDDQSAEQLLTDHGQTLAANGLRAKRQLTAKQRDGVYGTARPFMGWVRSSTVAPWVTPGEGRVEFDPAAFVASRQTIYLLSKEGAGSAGALTAALTVAVATAAEDRAIKQGGRLREPILFELDEAANICRWPDLPNLYSHYGSRGIILNTILQNWPQGVKVWGEDGMKAMWSAANVGGFGRGQEDAKYLEDVSRLVGDRDVRTRSATHSGGSRAGRSSTVSLRRERIFDVSDLRAFPKGRALLFASGTPAILAELVHYSDLDESVATMVEESQAHYGALGAHQ